MRNFVIKATRNGKEDTFYGRDYASGGYPVYLEHVSSAYFMTKEEAEAQMQVLKEQSTEHTVYTDGERRPAYELSVALNLSNKCLQETVTFSICKVELVVVGEEFTFTGKVEKPTFKWL